MKVDVIATAPPLAPRKSRRVAAIREPFRRPPPSSKDEELFLCLKTLRKEIADRAAVPAYVVFSDAALLDMVRLRPGSAQEFLLVSGVGRKKLARYGEEFLTAIREFGHVC